jgi:uncharacterized RDD family membrane protein YckC
MSIVRVPTNFNIDLEFEVPEFYRRLLAWLIDLLIQYFYLRIAISILTNVLSGRRNFSEDDQYNLSSIWMMILLPILVYHVVCEITMNGQSPGKKIFGIRVVNENGGRPGISQFIIRWLLRVSDYSVILIIFLYIVYGPYIFIVIPSLRWFALIAFFILITDIVLVVSNKKSQRIGDILAKTILIRTNTRGSINETVFIPVAENYIPSFPQIMQLNDKDINAIKSILEASRKKGDFSMAAAASEKIKNHLQIKTPLSPFDFLDVLLKDYNYLSTK